MFRAPPYQALKRLLFFTTAMNTLMCKHFITGLQIQSLSGGIETTHFHHLLEGLAVGR